MLKTAYQAQQRFFQQKAPDWHFPEADRKLFAQLLPILPISPAAVVLDVGCGTGQIGSWLKEQLPSIKVIGIDMCLAMLMAGKQTNSAGSPYYVGAFAEQLPIKSASCDLVLNYCVFPHFKARDLVVKEYYRVLKLGGSVVIIHPGGRQHTNQKHQEIGFPVAQDLLPSNDELIALFHSSAFEDVRLIDDDEVFYLDLRRA